MPGSGTNLQFLYDLRNSFTIIALTGRTGSGCTNVSKQLSYGFNLKSFPKPADKDLNNNSYRKYQIIYKYAERNFIKYTRIAYRDVLTLYFLDQGLDDLVDFLRSSVVLNFFRSSSLDISNDFTSEIIELNKLSEDFTKYRQALSSINQSTLHLIPHAGDFYSIFFSDEYRSFSLALHNALKSQMNSKHNLLLQLISNNIRKSGRPYDSVTFHAPYTFTIARRINQVINCVRVMNGKLPTKIVIDDLRNPFEVMFFRQKYAAFYLMAVNRDDKVREKKLSEIYKDEYDKISVLLENEYKGGKGKEFYKQYVRSCIEKADIHITFRSDEEVNALNLKTAARKEKISPYFTWQMQLLKYVCLIDKPGLITPSPEERCMQLAFTAKYNSGCISRQVGAAITDENYSVKAIGWNDTPEGQVPCLLRNAEALLNSTDNRLQADIQKPFHAQDPELKAFTPYEKFNASFKMALKGSYNGKIKDNEALLEGRSICFCFKSLQNSIVEGKNQVHTRSLHAEESAFLQITKYGGTAIKDGKLFTTASPCELCAKKAYQLGIKVIYYVDPYPGISQEQILEAGSIQPEIRLFNGAIGNAYHWLYEPFMSYKDELSLVLDLDIQDLTTQQKLKIEAQAKKIRDLEIENQNLKSSSEPLKHKAARD